jgi:hypothetical protein
MTDEIETDAPIGYQAVEFLDIPPMDEALAEPPSSGRDRDPVRAETST